MCVRDCPFNDFAMGNESWLRYNHAIACSDLNIHLRANPVQGNLW